VGAIGTSIFDVKQNPAPRGTGCDVAHHGRERGLEAVAAAVATAAGVSRATLYRDDNLRAVVEDHRHRGHDPRPLSGVLSEVQHLRTAVEALSEKVRRHDEQLLRIEGRRKAN